MFKKTIILIFIFTLTCNNQTSTNPIHGGRGFAGVGRGFAGGNRGFATPGSSFAGGYRTPLAGFKPTKPFSFAAGIIPSAFSPEENENFTGNTSSNLPPFYSKGITYNEED